MDRRPIAMDACVERVVVSRRRIASRVARLARQIAQTYEGQELHILAVMTGSLVFLADLIRHLPLFMRLDVASVRSYPGTATRSQGPALDVLPQTFAGKHVLVVDDILDSGRTLAALLEQVQSQHPASVRTCMLLRKHRPDIPARPEADFVGFDIEDQFVVGYGLDFDKLYRNLPDICVLRPEFLCPGGRP